jgi:hypothetical protein
MLKGFWKRLLYLGDSYWDEDAGFWRNCRGDYDDEANDTRPIGEKYPHKYDLIVLLMLSLFLGLLMLLVYVFRCIGSN